MSHHHHHQQQHPGRQSVEQLRAVSTKELRSEARTLRSAVETFRVSVETMDTKTVTAARINAIADECRRAIKLLDRRVCESEDQLRAISFGMLSDMKRELINVPPEWSEKKRAAIVPSDLGGPVKKKQPGKKKHPIPTTAAASASKTTTTKRRRGTTAAADSDNDDDDDDAPVKTEQTSRKRPAIAKDPKTGRSMVAPLFPMAAQPPS